MALSCRIQLPAYPENHREYVHATSPELRSRAGIPYCLLMRPKLPEGGRLIVTKEEVTCPLCRGAVVAAK